MPNPQSYKLFARTHDIGNGTPNDPHFLCDRRFPSFHHQTLDTLGNDRRYGDYFTYFALRIFIWGITRYAGGSKTFHIPYASFIIKQLNEEGNIARSLGLVGAQLDTKDWSALTFGLNKEYIRNSRGCYQSAIAKAAELLEGYEPLRRVGAAYMQIKRAGELRSKILNSIDVQRLMNCLQQAAFDITSYNMGLSMVHTLAVESRGSDCIAEPISSFFAPKIDSKMEFEANDLIRGMEELIECLGQANIGEFLTVLNERLYQYKGETINIAQMFTALASEYQVNPPLELAKDDRGNFCVKSPLQPHQSPYLEEYTYQQITTLSLFSSSGKVSRQPELKSKCYLL